MKPKSVIVLGAGIGGITAAIHLALRGLHVTVLEKNTRAVTALAEKAIILTQALLFS